MMVSNGAYSITTDKNRLDIDFIHSFLARSYWAEGIPKEIVERSIKESLCFGVFKDSPPLPSSIASADSPPSLVASVDAQVGFARMVTDEATFAYLADVFIIEEHRGKGLSKWLVQVILSHPGLQGLRRIMLATRDAHGLYAQSGFTPLNNPERWMHIHKPDVYKRN